MMRIMARRMKCSNGRCVAFEVASQAAVTTNPWSARFPLIVEAVNHLKIR
jgi:hypothetical protein